MGVYGVFLCNFVCFLGGGQNGLFWGYFDGFEVFFEGYEKTYEGNEIDRNRYFDDFFDDFFGFG